MVVGQTCYTKNCKSRAACEFGYPQSCRLDGPSSRKQALNPWKVKGLRVDGNTCVGIAYKDSTGITVSATCGAAPTTFVDSGDVWMEGQTTVSCPNGFAIQCLCYSDWSVYQCGEDNDAVPTFEPQNGVCTKTLMTYTKGRGNRRRGTGHRRRGEKFGSGSKIGAICSEGTLLDAGPSVRVASNPAAMSEIVFGHGGGMDSPS